MISFNWCIGVLREHRHSASFCQPFGTVFHHAQAASLPICAVSVAMIETSGLTSLMPKTTFPQTAPPGLCPTTERAVSVAMVTAAAQEKHLTTVAQRADHQPKRFHIPG